MNHYCQQASRLASDRLERSLGFGERFYLWLHLAMCLLCRSHAHAVSQIHAVTSSQREANTPPQLDSKQRQRIAEALQQK